ncbi:MAG: hypothetical protein B6229_05210 [Spirochaetaceae bacterium 4572_7]|nr:MAG: hypothetical protein B6229_05210 [Spirochaetaceae bacterium 4572_7]
MTIALIFVSTQSCDKEDDPLQPTWQWLFSPYLILDGVEKVHNDNLNHIEAGRTTIGDYQWGDSTISLTSPAGYSILSKIAAQKLTQAYENAIMSDTTKLSKSGVVPESLQKYLDNRREEDPEDAYDDMRLGISNDLYEMNEFAGERILLFFYLYFTKDIGGTSEWYSGTRSLEKEKELRGIMTSTDWNGEDPWGSNSSMQTYNELWYLDYSEGDVKSANIQEVNSLSKEEVQLKCAEIRYNQSSQIGDIEDYKTKHDEERGVYYIILK